MLTPQETKEIFAVLRRLADEGHSIIFISHKLYEVLEIADRITVVRRGKVVGSRIPSETDEDDLAEGFGLDLTEVGAVAQSATESPSASRAAPPRAERGPEAGVVRDAEEYYQQMYRAEVSSWNLRDRHIPSVEVALIGFVLERARQFRGLRHVADADLVRELLGLVKRLLIASQ